MDEVYRQANETLIKGSGLMTRGRLPSSELCSEGSDWVISAETDIILPTHSISNTKQEKNDSSTEGDSTNSTGININFIYNDETYYNSGLQFILFGGVQQVDPKKSWDSTHRSGESHESNLST